jgi:hypothetical protein
VGQLTALTAWASLQASYNYQNLLQAFRTGGAAVGRAFQAYGTLGQKIFERVATQFREINPNVMLRPGRRVNANVLDYIIKYGNKIIDVEVKWSFPRKAEALKRLTSQMSSAAASAEAEVVLWFFRTPGAKQMERLEQAVGPSFSRVTPVYGISDLWTYLIARFGAL